MSQPIIIRRRMPSFYGYERGEGLLLPFMASRSRALWLESNGDPIPCSFRYNLLAIPLESIEYFRFYGTYKFETELLRAQSFPKPIGRPVGCMTEDSLEEDSSVRAREFLVLADGSLVAPDFVGPWWVEVDCLNGGSVLVNFMECFYWDAPIFSVWPDHFTGESDLFGEVNYFLYSAPGGFWFLKVIEYLDPKGEPLYEDLAVYVRQASKKEVLAAFSFGASESTPDQVREWIADMDITHKCLSEDPTSHLSMPSIEYRRYPGEMKANRTPAQPLENTDNDSIAVTTDARGELVNYDFLFKQFMVKGWKYAHHLIEAMRSIDSMSHQDVADKVWGNVQTDGDTIGAYIRRVNRALEELNSKLRFDNKCGHIIKHIIP